MAETKDAFFQTRLVADVPTQIRGQFMGFRVLDGAHPQVYLFAENPGSSVDLSQGIRLGMKGMVVHRKMTNPWVVSVGLTINPNAPALQLELFQKEIVAVVDARSPEPLLTVTHGSNSGAAVSAAAEKLIGQILYGNQVVDDGQVLSPRGFFTGFVSADGAFEVDLRARDATNNWWTLIVAPGKETVTGEFAMSIDSAAWDPQKTAAGSFSTFMTPSRLPVPHAAACGLWVRNTSGGSISLNAYVGVKNR